MALRGTGTKIGGATACITGNNINSARAKIFVKLSMAVPSMSTVGVGITNDSDTPEKNQLASFTVPPDSSTTVV